MRNEMKFIKYHGTEIQRVPNHGTGQNEFNYFCGEIRENLNGYNVAKCFKSLRLIQAAIREAHGE